MQVHRVAVLGAALLAPCALASHPLPLLNLTQQSPQGTTLSAGGTTAGSTVWLTADSDPATFGGTYYAEFEVRPIAQAFTGSVTHTSGQVAKNGSGINLTYPLTAVANLNPGTSYKWQVRERLVGVSTVGTWTQFNGGLTAFTVVGVQLSPANVAFGIVRAGQTSPAKTVEVSNDTTGSITVNTATISTGAPFTIISGPSLPLTLASGAKATFSISAAPMSVGAHNGTFTVTSTAPNSPHSAALTVTGGLPILTLPSTSVSFGDVGINGVGLTLNVPVKNNGNAALTLLGGSVAAPFSVSPTAAGLTIAAGQTENVPVTFAPTALGVHSATLTLSSDDPNSPHSVSLSGTGIDPKVALSDAQVSFANTIINATATSSTITLSNSGTGTLVLGAPTVTGPFTTTLAAGSVAQGSSTTFTVTFAPTSPGAKTGSVIIPSNDGTSPATLPLSGFALAPVLAASPASHSFGTVSLGSSPSTTITLTNAGDTTLNVSALGLSGSNTAEFALSGVPGTPFTIGAGANQQFSVAFTPAHVGVRAAEIVIQSDRYPAGALEIPLSGTGDGARVSLAPASLDFGKLNVGEGTDRTFVIGNSGSAPLTVSGLTFGGASSTDYGTTKATPFAVSPGASSSVTVTFRPSAVGVRQADLTVASNDALAPSGQVGLSGEGISPAVAVDPAMLSFGPVRVAQTLTRSVSISNTGNGPLSIGSVAITGQDAAKFSIVAGGGSFVIAPGAPDRVISVRFSPTALGAASAELAIVTDDPTSPNVTVPLSGEGVTPGVAVSATQINFGGQPVGLTSAPRAFTVTNSGTTILQVSSVALSGADAASYAIPSPLGAFALAPGGEKQVQVVVSPKKIGEHSAKVVVTTDAAESPTAEVQLAALGISEVLSVDQSALAFGAVRVNQEAPAKQVVLSSAAADAVPLAGAWFTGTGAAHFAVELSAATVEGGGSVTATVRYRPKNASSHSAELVLASALTRVPEVRIPVTGTGLSRMFDLSQASLEFGSITVGESTEQVVTLTNKTGAAVTITGLSTSHDEFAAVTPLPLTVEAGAEARLTLSFSPTAAHAAFAHAAVLVNNAPESSPEVIVALSGTGVEKAGCSASSGSMALWAVAFAACSLLARRRRGVGEG